MIQFFPTAKTSLLVADSTGGGVYQISGRFVPGTAYIAADSDNSVGTFDTTSGTYSPIVTGLSGPHGLAFCNNCALDTTRGIFHR
jgi:hypothetical protein